MSNGWTRFRVGSSLKGILSSLFVICESMDKDILRREVDANYDAFQRMLAEILPGYRDQYALMRDRAIVGFFGRPGDAYRAGLEKFSDERFSIQEVTDEPIDLGFYSHVAH